MHWQTTDSWCGVWFYNLTVHSEQQQQDKHCMPTFNANQHWEQETAVIVHLICLFQTRRQVSAVFYQDIIQHRGHILLFTILTGTWVRWSPVCMIVCVKNGWYGCRHCVQTISVCNKVHSPSLQLQHKWKWILNHAHYHQQKHQHCMCVLRFQLRDWCRGVWQPQLFETDMKAG